MTDLLREIAKLPQVQGALSVELLAGEPSGRFYLLRASARPGADLAVLQGDETEGYARLLSGAPVMLDLLAVLLLRWGKFVALGRGQARSGLLPAALLPVGQGDPGADRMRRRLELAGQVVRRSSGTHQINHLTAELRGIGWAAFGHKGHLA